MEATPEDQHSHQGRQDNLNEFRSMRDRMHPPRMSAPSCQGVSALGLTYKLNSSRNFFPTHRTNGLKRQISNFSAKENEKFYEYWERYMEAINACPHHGFDTWLLVSYFYDGMSSSMKQLLETMCGGDFMSKNPEEAMDFLSYVAEVSRGWDEPTKGEVGKMKSQLAVTRRLEELELKKAHEVQAVAEAPVQVKLCPNCQSYEHLVEECPTSSAERECLEIKQMLLDNSSPITMHLMEILTTQVGRIIQFLMEGQSNSVPTVRSTISTISSLEQAIANLSKVVGDFVGNQKAINAQLSQRIEEWRVL
ncbi:hypothetical protein CK203_045781 [Vitis vinifera]|uniref:Retrotransposon gag domain-containing protein n=1 Tax=Vitis vinifera TaxID=29760 RepID=A0A438I0Z8_VITVI|nr:hypothetical protein CK203_045781 [Vitis vinifera]